MTHDISEIHNSERRRERVLGQCPFVSEGWRSRLFCACIETPRTSSSQLQSLCTCASRRRRTRSLSTGGTCIHVPRTSPRSMCYRVNSVAYRDQGSALCKRNRSSGPGYRAKPVVPASFSSFLSCSFVCPLTLLQISSFSNHVRKRCSEAAPRAHY